MTWNNVKPTPLFQRLDLKILERENSVKTSHSEDDSVHSVKGGKKKKKEEKNDRNRRCQYPEFDQFMAVDLKLGKILSVEDHPNADNCMSLI